MEAEEIPEEDAVIAPVGMASMPPEVIQAIVKRLLDTNVAADTVSAACFSFASKDILEASRGAWTRAPSDRTTRDLVTLYCEDVKWCECGEFVWEEDRLLCSVDFCDWACSRCQTDNLCPQCKQLVFCNLDDQICDRCEELEEARRNRQFNTHVYFEDDEDDDHPECACGQSAALECRMQSCYDCCTSKKCARHNGPRERFY
jgi:hypothetical protein